MSSAGGLVPFPPSTDVERLRLCSVCWTISLLIEGNSRSQKTACVVDRSREVTCFLLVISSSTRRWGIGLVGAGATSIGLTTSDLSRADVGMRLGFVTNVQLRYATIDGDVGISSELGWQLWKLLAEDVLCWSR